MIYLVCSDKEKTLGHTTLDTQIQQILLNLISVLLPLKQKKRKALWTFHTLPLLFVKHSAIRHCPCMLFINICIHVQYNVYFIRKTNFDLNRFFELCSVNKCCIPSCRIKNVKWTQSILAVIQVHLYKKHFQKEPLYLEHELYKMK